MKTNAFLVLVSVSYFSLSLMAFADTDIIRLPDTTHSYSGGNVGSGANSIDGDFNTYYGGNFGGISGAYVTSAHTFSQPRLITQIDFKFYVHAYEYGDDTGYVTIRYYVQWYNGSVWETIPDSYWNEHREQYHDSLDLVKSSGHVTLTGLNLIDCSAVKAQAYVVAYNNKNSNANAQAYIYEIQAWAPVTVPVVSTLDASVYPCQASLSGIVTDTGGDTVIEQGLEWGTSSGDYPDYWEESSSIGFGPCAFSHIISNLDLQETYYFRAKARNSIGWGYGEEKSFTLSEYITDLNYFSHFAGFWLDACNECNYWCEGSDTNYDGNVGLEDLEMLENNWLQYYSSEL